MIRCRMGYRYFVIVTWFRSSSPSFHSDDRPELASCFSFVRAFLNERNWWSLERNSHRVGGTYVADARGPAGQRRLFAGAVPAGRRRLARPGLAPHVAGHLSALRHFLRLLVVSRFPEAKEKQSSEFQKSGNVSRCSWYLPGSLFFLTRNLLELE